MTDSERKQTQEVLRAFLPEGAVRSCERFGNGHINDTYLVECAEGYPRYVLQRINREVFHNLHAVSDNVEKITDFLREKIIAQGGDPNRETLTLIPDKEGRKSHMDGEGQCWRLVLFIEDAVCYEQVERPEDFYLSGKAFGHFQRMLADYPAETLVETIPHFHDTPSRLKALWQAVRKDVCGYAGQVAGELEFVAARERECGTAMDMLAGGELPLRVTHNDTKLNNIMFDAKTGDTLCVLDLDTIMPGLSIFDFGDAIRFGANTALEDERDTGKVSLSLELYEMFVRGFLEGCQGSLTDNEVRMLPMGAKLMTMECGIRFLTDYLEGSVYFHIDYPEHNLVRARTQFALAQDMERKWKVMTDIVDKYRT